MKLKYFLRGVGVGIIFGALIMLVAYLTSGANNLSDDEIIKRAENLGMVMENELVITGDNQDSTENAESTETTEKTQTENTTNTQASTSETATEEIIQGSDVSLEGVVDNAVNPTTEEITTEAPDANYVTAKITVSSGMTSTEVAILLQEAGIIDDYLDFDAYLNENGYSTQIKINDYDFNSNMTYEELAKALIKEDKK